MEHLLYQEGLISEGDSLYSATNISLLHHVNAALRAHMLFEKDVDYIVRQQEIVIVDEHTGRLMDGRRWSEGLHQAVEAKENVNIKHENQTLASITFQNYFRLYEKLAGMTGTAETEAFEFQSIYGLETVVIPTNKPMVRQDNTDLVFIRTKEKYEAIIEDIKDCQKREQPVLVGTASIEMSELLSKMLKKEKLKHNVLNAKFHHQEADIIAQAGRAGAITIATSMAGRGTDIVLGGNWEQEVKQLSQPTDTQIQKIKDDWKVRHDQILANGGLRVIGTERHESRRIDNQLRGRSGRQGDPGSSRFYLSMEDQLMRLFASERAVNMMRRVGMNYEEALEHPWMNRAIENAQRKVEQRNFDIRKHLLEFDDVANEQRQVIYAKRNELMEAENIQAMIQEIAVDVIDQCISTFIPPQSLDDLWDIPGLTQQLQKDFLLDLPLQAWLDDNKQLDEVQLREKIAAAWTTFYQEKEQAMTAPMLRHFEKVITLQTLDGLWKEHLASMDHLRQGIHLRSYAQKNPKQEYKRESFDLFKTMLETLKYDVITILSKFSIQTEADTPADEEPQVSFTRQKKKSPIASPASETTAVPDAATPDAYAHVGRNDPCPCGSSKKFKHCHGKIGQPV